MLEKVLISPFPSNDDRAAPQQPTPGINHLLSLPISVTPQSPAILPPTKGRNILPLRQVIGIHRLAAGQVLAVPEAVRRHGGWTTKSKIKTSRSEPEVKGLSESVPLAANWEGRCVCDSDEAWTWSLRADQTVPMSVKWERRCISDRDAAWPSCEGKING